MNIKLLSLLLLIPAYLGAMDSKSTAQIKDEEKQIQQNQADDFVQAARKGDTKCIQKMLDEGIDPNVKDQWGDTALIYATSAGKMEAVHLLLSYGANPNVHGTDGTTADKEAFKAKNHAILGMLMAYGANEAGYKVGDKGRLNQHYNTRVKRFLKVVENGDLVIAKRFLAISVGTATKSQALCIASKAGNVAMIKLLLSYKGFVSYITLGNAPNLEILLILLNAAPDLSVQLFYNTILGEANATKIELCLSLGLHQKYGFKRGLNFAIQKNNAEAVALLLRYGANPDEIGILESAVNSGNSKIVATFFEYGADPERLTSTEQLALKELLKLTMEKLV